MKEYGIVKGWKVVHTEARGPDDLERHKLDKWCKRMVEGKRLSAGWPTSVLGWLWLSIGYGLTFALSARVHVSSVRLQDAFVLVDVG